MAGRPKGYQRDQLIEIAQKLFKQKGYSAASLQELTSKMKVSKSTFYSAFESKDDLYKICLENYGKSFFREMVQYVSAGNPVIQSLEQYYNYIASERERTLPPEGCFLVSSASEIGRQHPTLSPIVSDLMRLAQNTLKNALELAKRKGELSESYNCEDGAAFLLGQMCAIRTLVKSDYSVDELTRLVSSTFASLRTVGREST
jgi:TetR/AcrR family transcriptional repressor of nem operon